MIRVAGCWIFLVIFKSVPAQTPTLVLPVGHTSSVSSASFSPNGKYIVTASWDNTAKVWISPEGRLLVDLKGHSGSLLSASFNNNGLRIVTTSKDSTARIWDANGQLLFELLSHTDWVTTAAFTPNDEFVFTTSWDNTIKKWETGTGKLNKTIRGHRGPVNTIAFSKDGKYFVTSSKDSTARTWISSSGKLLKTLSGHRDWVNAAVISSNGKYIVTASRDGTAIIWDALKGTRMHLLKGHGNSINTAVFDESSTLVATSSNDGTAMVWNVNTGERIGKLTGHEGPVTAVSFCKNLPLITTASTDNTVKIWNLKSELLSTREGHTAALNSIAFDRDNHYLVSSAMDNTARIWSVSDSGFSVPLAGHTSVVTSASYSKDGRYIVTASWDNTAKIWNGEDGKLLSALKGHTDWINTASFSADGKYVVTASSDNTARIWSVPSGNLVHELSGHTDWVGSAIFSADGKYVVTTSWDNTSKIFLSASGKEIAELRGHTDYVRWIDFSNDGRYLVTASADNTARIWSMPDGKLVHELTGHTGKVITAAFTHDDNFVVTASYDSTARIWDATTGKTISILSGHKGSLNAALISPDGKQVTTTSMDNTAITWNLKDGTLLHRLAVHKNSINSAHYSIDGKSIVLGSWDNTASIWNAESGKLAHLFKGHTGSIKSASFSPDAKFLITTSEDNTIKKWNAVTGQFLYTFFAVDSTDYLAIDEYGRYDGSENARKKLYYACGSELVDLEQFKNLSWEPGLISKIKGFNKEPITAKKTEDISICNYTPLVTEKGIVSGNYTFLITPRSGGIGDIQLYVNGKLLRTYSPSDLSKIKNELWLQVNQDEVNDYFLDGADNTLTVKATTTEGMMISRGANQVVNNPKKKQTNPDMYVVAVGISEYKGDKLKLKYASKDAVDFTAAIKTSAEKLLNTDGRQHVFSYDVNTEAGSTNWPAKTRIQQLIDSISLRATADDILLIFFAGHGILQTAEKKFYLLTAEASSIELNGVEKDVAISTDELREWLRKIRANKQLLILDACNSGLVVQQLQELVGRRDVPADQQRALENLKDKTGTYILSASASGQAAYETSLYGQGLLTYSLLSGIKFGNGLRDNKFIDVTRWFNYASDNVKMMAREIGGRQDPQIIGNATFEIGIVDKDVVDKIQLSTRKKVFGRSIFIQDEDLLNDDLGIAYLVDKELNNVAASGKNSPWVYVADNPMLETYAVKGRYEIRNNKILAKVSIVKGQKERVHQFEISGTTDKKEHLAIKIVDTIRFYMSQPPKTTL